MSDALIVLGEDGVSFALYSSSEFNTGVVFAFSLQAKTAILVHIHWCYAAILLQLILGVDNLSHSFHAVFVAAIQIWLFMA